MLGYLTSTPYPLALPLTRFEPTALFLGWLAATWIRYRYESKQITDQTVTIDSLWLLLTLSQCVDLNS